MSTSTRPATVDTRPAADNRPTAADSRPAGRSRFGPARPWLRFTAHFAEMVVAMFVGMIALGPLWSLAAPGLSGDVAAEAMVMATDMTVGMAAWMAVRRHSWARIAEMGAAMYVPFLVLLVPYALGMITGGTLMVAGHVIMMPLMLAAMLWRRADYAHGHH